MADGFKARAEHWAAQLGLPLQLEEADFSCKSGNTACNCNSSGLTRRGRCAWTSSKAARRIGVSTAVAAGR